MGASVSQWSPRTLYGLPLPAVPSPADDPFKHGKSGVGLRAIELAPKCFCSCGDAFIERDIIRSRVMLLYGRNAYELFDSIGGHENAGMIDVGTARCSSENISDRLDKCPQITLLVV